MEVYEREWVCLDCGQITLTYTDEPPRPIRWADGHTCGFVEVKAWEDHEIFEEEGGG